MLKFLFELLNNFIDCPENLEHINFKVNGNKHPFYLSIIKTNYMSYYPAIILCHVETFLITWTCSI